MKQLNKGEKFPLYLSQDHALKKSFDLKFFNFPYMLHLKKCKENLFYQNRLSSLSFIACHTPDTFA